MRIDLKNLHLHGSAPDRSSSVCSLSGRGITTEKFFSLAQRGAKTATLENALTWRRRIRAIIAHLCAEGGQERPLLANKQSATAPICVD